MNRSRDHLILNNKSIFESTTNNKRATKDRDNSSHVNSSLKKRVSFQGATKHKPGNVDNLGLRRSPRLVNNNKKLDTTLNHSGFMHVIDPLEEDNIETKETNSFKEAMNIPCEK